MRWPGLTLCLCSLAALSACGDDGTNPADGSGSGDETGSTGPTTSPTTSPEDTTVGTGTDSSTGSTTAATESLDTSGSSSTTGELGEGCIVHVDAANGNDAAWGGSWAGAVRTLQTGLSLAAEYECDVWVAAGTYYPSEVDDPAASFVLFPGARVYGGFAGDETAVDERDWLANVTVLSGDIGVPGAIDDDSLHVVTGADGALLDGLTVTRGHARAELGAYDGGGLWLMDGAMQLVHCTFEDNRASDGLGLVGDIGGVGGSGGGVFAIGSLVVDDCTFVGNVAGSGVFGPNIGGPGGSGGAIFVNGSLEVRGSTFTSNVAGAGGPGNNLGGPAGSGGAIFTNGLGLTVSGSTFSGNVAGAGGSGENVGGPAGGGGAIFAGGTTLEVHGSTFTGNDGGAGGSSASLGGGANGAGAVYGFTTEGLVVEGCLFEGNSAGLGGPAPTPGGAGAGGAMIVRSNGAAPLLVAHNLFVDNDAGPVDANGVGGALFVSSSYTDVPQGEVLVMGNVIVGNRASVGGGISMRSKGSAAQAIVSCSIADNEAFIGGGLWYQSLDPEGMVGSTLADSIVWGNTASTGPQIWVSQGFIGDPIVPLTMSSTDIQGGCVEDMSGTLLCGAGNLDVDPDFVDVAAGDLRLSAGSAVQDQGSDAWLPADLLDLDADGDALEPWSLDPDGNARSSGLAVDLGAYELP